MSELRFMTAGESHGPCLTAIIEGLPAGLSLNADAINRDLARRQQGYGRGGRMKIETDKADVLSGVRFNETLGGPIALRVVNRDFAKWGAPRPRGFYGCLQVCTQGRAGYLGAFERAGDDDARRSRRDLQGIFACARHGSRLARRDGRRRIG